MSTNVSNSRLEAERDWTWWYYCSGQDRRSSTYQGTNGVQRGRVLISVSLRSIFLCSQLSFTCDSYHLGSMLAVEYTTCLCGFEAQFHFDLNFEFVQNVIYVISINLPHHMSPKTVPNQMYSIVKLPPEEEEERYEKGRWVQITIIMIMIIIWKDMRKNNGVQMMATIELTS